MANFLRYAALAAAMTAAGCGDGSRSPEDATAEAAMDGASTDGGDRDASGPADGGGACEESCSGEPCGYLSCFCESGEMTVMVDCVDGCCEAIDCEARCGGG